MAELTVANFRIAIICALPLERTAVQAMLDEEHETHFATPGDNNTYTFGVVGKHNVIVASLGAKRYGTVAGSGVANDLRRTFPALKFALLVGIAGGVPRPDEEDGNIRLGDIVVACAKGGPSIINHSAGTHTSTEFLIQSDVTGPPELLRRAVGALMSSYPLTGPRHLSHLKQMFESHPRLYRPGNIRNYYGRPLRPDVLYHATAEHIRLASDCAGCLETLETVTRPERVLDAPPDGVEDAAFVINTPEGHNEYPKVFYGTIASADTLVKSATRRDELYNLVKAQHKVDVLCFEMEAAGIARDWPCLVIRGICDYSDSHKNDDWQNFAAATAAAYAKEILLSIKPDTVRVETSIGEYPSSSRLHGAHADMASHPVAGASRSMSNLVQGVGVNNTSYAAAGDQNFIGDSITNNHFHGEIDKSSKQLECLATFATVNYDDFKDRPNCVRIQGTCQWVLNHEIYRHWLAINAPGCHLLWVTADPGCGKSVLARSLVDQDLPHAMLQAASGATTICHFFFKDNAEQDNLATALCAILHQLFEHQPRLLEVALAFWKTHRRDIVNNDFKLWQLLLQLVTSDIVQPICIVFDALDECRDKDRETLISWLVKLRRSQKCKSQLKILTTSRPYAEIENAWDAQLREEIKGIRVSGEEDNDAIRDEIDIVIDIVAPELFSKFDVSDAAQARLLSQLKSMEHRTYLWLHLAMADLETSLANSLGVDVTEIDPVPESVSMAYAKILARVSDARFEQVSKVLAIIAGARRPLAIGELTIALGFAMRPDVRTVAEAKYDTQVLQGWIRRHCGLFVFFNQDRVYLLHQTAKEFLLTTTSGTIPRWTFTPVAIEALMGKVAIKTLTCSKTRPRPKGHSDAHNHSHWTPEENLFIYAACNWGDHIRLGITCVPPACRHEMELLYDISGLLFETWFRIYERLQESLVYLSFKGLHKEHVLAILGHVEEFSAHSIDIDAKDEHDRTPLIYAAARGHTDVMELLLDIGADIDHVSERGWFALERASRAGHEAAVELLLDRGAIVFDSKRHTYGNALSSAIEGGSITIVRSILAAGQGQDIGFSRALSTAVFLGQRELFNMLLASSEAISGADALKDEVLNDAASAGYEDVVRKYLALGAGPDAQNSSGETALYQACSGGHCSIVKLLLDRGAGIDADGGFLGNALQAASHFDKLEVVQLLLDRDADINAQGGQYGNALQAASYHGHLEIVQLLLDRGADVNAQGGEYGNALQGASSNGHLEIVQLLLDRGADINAQGGEYGNTLQGASSNGHLEIVQLLLDRGADVNAHGKEYGNTLQAASYHGHLEIVQLLLDRGADVNAQGGAYGNALQAACKSEFVSEGPHCRFALNATARSGRIDVLQLLLDRGADVNAQGGHCGSSLQAAARSGEIDFVQLLLDRGADINAQGGHDGSSLVAAARSGDIEVVQLLLDRGADVNAQGAPYGSALQAAVQGGKIDVVQLLLDRGADINTQGGPHGSVLQVAARMGKIDVVQLLLDRGADVNAKGGHHGSALLAASVQNHLATVELLINRGADVNTQGGPYGSALQATVDVDVVQLLLDRGADVNAQGGYCGSALLAAIFESNMALVELLINHGADVNIKTSRYDCALLTATAHWSDRSVDMIQLLLASGAVWPPWPTWPFDLSADEELDQDLPLFWWLIEEIPEDDAALVNESQQSTDDPLECVDAEKNAVDATLMSHDQGRAEMVVTSRLHTASTHSDVHHVGWKRPLLPTFRLPEFWASREE